MAQNERAMTTILLHKTQTVEILEIEAVWSDGKAGVVVTVFTMGQLERFELSKLAHFFSRDEATLYEDVSVRWSVRNQFFFRPTRSD